MKPIPNYEGLYSATEDGNIYSHLQNKYLATCIDSNGYNIVSLYKNNEKKSYSIHRIVALTFISNPNNLNIIDHIDRNKTNNHRDNLRWITHSNNIINTDTYKNNKLGHKHIYKKENAFRVDIRRTDIKYYKYCKTIEEAIQTRDDFLNRYE
jgi:hypothetical protein